MNCLLNRARNVFRSGRELSPKEETRTPRGRQVTFGVSYSEHGRRFTDQKNG